MERILSKIQLLGTRCRALQAGATRTFNHPAGYRKAGFHGNELLLGMILAASPVMAQDAALEQLSKECPYEAHRITSSDPSGGNDDWRYLEPGGTLVLADIKGPGCIVHLRDNITSKEPHHLQYHILRIFWDSEVEPSVEVPVGDFFGIGFGFTARMSSAAV